MLNEFAEWGDISSKINKYLCIVVPELNMSIIFVPELIYFIYKFDLFEIFGLFYLYQQEAS